MRPSYENSDSECSRMVQKPCVSRLGDYSSTPEFWINFRKVWCSSDSHPRCALDLRQLTLSQCLALGFTIDGRGHVIYVRGSFSFMMKDEILRILPSETFMSLIEVLDNYVCYCLALHKLAVKHTYVGF